MNRLLRDDPSKGDMNNRDPLSFYDVWCVLKAYDMWPQYLLALVAFLPTIPPGQYLTLTLRQLGFSVLSTNLLTIPAAVGKMLSMIFVTWLSGSVGELALCGRSFCGLPMRADGRGGGDRRLTRHA